ncbi:hypothetical protein NGB36_05280 [Streptomyces sp. RB6PN25]|uniref:Lipoprotein n=1 Tax=Streptomyces humicola TaxID=2953240 RepID=A0ABT1PQS9_9ACTN|nr:hypothetical protein [Streptomyces humicola]MCQ4080019.1 hypothetical protein [Streptomyces humicola]
MRSRSTTATATAVLLAATTVGLSATAATAVSSASGVSGGVSPSTVRPGQAVHVTMAGCESATSASADGGGAFGAVQLQPLSGGEMSGITQVYPDAKPGAEYPVTFTCDGMTAHGTITIAGTSSSSSPTSSPSAALRKGARTGAGGTFGGMNATQIGLGAALLLAAIGGGAATARRRPDDGS